MVATSKTPAANKSILARFPQFPGHYEEGSDYYAPTNHGPPSFFALGDTLLESGATLPGARLAYRTHGTLSPARDNAILFPHMYSGTPRSMEAFIGAGRPLDPADYFIIFPGMLGNGISSSPSNQPTPNNASNFPQVSIGDDVEAQHRLVTEEFGLTELQLVLGWSMGAQQTYEWAVRYPNFVKRAMPIAGTAKTTQNNKLTVEMMCNAIESDPKWAGGNYPTPDSVESGLKMHADLFSVLGVCPDFYRDYVYMFLGYPYDIDVFVQDFWHGWFAPMDPNNLLCMLQKWKRADVTRFTDSDLTDTLGRVTANTTVVAFSDDQLFPPSVCEADARMITASTFKTIDSKWAHFAMMCLDEHDQRALDALIAGLLATPV